MNNNTDPKLPTKRLKLKKEINNLTRKSHHHPHPLITHKETNRVGKRKREMRT